jgi:hypothetical protein
MDIIEVAFSLTVIGLFIAHLHWYRHPKYKYMDNPSGSFIVTKGKKCSKK